MKNLTERITEYLLPTRILYEKDCENSSCLLNSRVQQVYLEESDICLLKKGGYIVLDFGKELHGGVRFLSARSSSRVRIRFGESVSETFAELGDKNAGNYHSLRDFETDIPSLSDMSVGQTGFRFVRIDNVDGEDVKFVGIYATYLHLKEKPIGKFSCSDNKINEIFDTAVYTLFLCMQNRLWDGAKRDRLVWIGDMHPESMGVRYIYGDHPFIEMGLKETADSTPEEMWIDNIPSYSFWWLAILSEYDFYCDKWDFVSSQIEYAEKLVGKISKFVDENGRMNYLDKNNMFICWESSESGDLECANRGLLLWSLKLYLNMLSRHNKKSPESEKIIARLLKNKSFTGESKIIASIYSMGYGIDDKVKRIICDGKTDGFSVFMSYYIATAMKNCGESELALKMLKKFYSAMIDRGATSFWESFDMSWLKGSSRIDELPKDGEKDLHSSFGKHCYVGYRLSLCHGWSCGPIQFLMENALGVRFVEPGGSKIKIQPDLMGLKWAKGVIPTKFGNIKIENRITDKGIETKYKLPKGITLVE